MSPYRCTADIAGTSHAGQLHGLGAPTLDPSTDTYVRVKAVREWSELIVQGAASGGDRAYTGQLATMARQLYRALRSLNNRSWTMLKLKGMSTTNTMTKLLLWSRLLASSEKSRSYL
jgi:hypothetical protein